MIKNLSGISYGRVAASALLALGLAACLRSVPPEAIPPRLLFFTPSSQDTLLLDESGEIRFELQAQAGEDAIYRATLEGEEQPLEAGGFTLRPADHDLVWPHMHADSLVTVQLSVDDAGLTLEKSWPVLVEVLPGLEVVFEPEASGINATVGETLHFKIGIRNIEPPIQFSFRLNGTSVGSDSTFSFVPRDVGDYQVRGHAWKQSADLDIERNWNVLVSCDDHTPPVPPTNLRIGPGPEPGQLVAAFTPPQDEEDLARYELRLWHQPLDPQQWDSTDLAGQPDADPEAEEEVITFSDLDAGLFKYARVRAYDKCGNPSEWSALAEGKIAGYAVTGVVLDWETGEGIPGLEVLYGIGDPEDVVTDTTDAQGRFHCSDVPYMSGNTGNPVGLVRDERTDETGLWYDIGDTRAVNDSLHYNHGSFGHQATQSGAYPDYLSYLRHMMDAEFWNEQILHMAYPIAVHVQEFSYNGVNYTQLLRNALAIWEDDCGLDLFTEVSSAGAAELLITYYPGSSGSGWFEILERDLENHVPLRGRIHWMANGLPGSEQTLQRVILHELGHALGPWNHSLELLHVLATTNQVDRPSADEVKLIRILANMGTRQDIQYLLDD
jgi:hypothetical protein